MYIRQHIYSDLIRAYCANKDIGFRHILKTMTDWLDDTDCKIVNKMIKEYLEEQMWEYEYHECQDVEKHNKQVTRFLSYI